MPLVLHTLAWSALVAALAVSPAFPEATNIVTLAVMAVSLPLLAVPAHREVFARPRAWLPVAGAFLLLVLALIPTTRSADNFLVLAILAPVWLALPFAALLRRVPRLTPTAVALLALTGTMVATGITAYDYYDRGISRAGELTMNPIHMGDLVLMLGFIALSGIFDGKGKWRALFLLGPLLALPAVWWTGSRGPLVASAGMILIATLYAAHLLQHRWRNALLGGVALAALAVLAHGLATGWLWQIRGIDQLVALLSGGASEDNSVNVRLVMYWGALQAFLASPIWGHGFTGFVQVVVAYAPSAGIEIFEHLHNDIADFAVIGGLLGLLAYLLILLAPILATSGATPDQRRPTLYLALITSAGYLGMGLTNAMFGILVLTVLYGVVIALCHQR